MAIDLGVLKWPTEGREDVEIATQHMAPFGLNAIPVLNCPAGVKVSVCVVYKVGEECHQTPCGEAILYPHYPGGLDTLYLSLPKIPPGTCETQLVLTLSVLEEAVYHTRCRLIAKLIPHDHLHQLREEIRRDLEERLRRI